MDSLSSLSDGESTFHQAVDLMKRAFEQKTIAANHEIRKWKQQSEMYQAQAQELQGKVHTLTGQVLELERQLHSQREEFNVERSQLVEGRNAAINAYNDVKNHVQQLQNFKKSIASMISDAGDAAVSVFPDAEAFRINMDSMLNALPTSHNVSPSNNFGSTLGTSLKSSSPMFSSKPVSTNYSGDPGRFPGSTSSPLFEPKLSPSLSAKPTPNTSSSPHLQPANSSNTKNSASIIEPIDGDEPIDAQAFYKQVSQALDPESFRDFAGNIKRLNAGQQTVGETLSKIGNIFGADRPHLYTQLQKLIAQSLEVRNV